MKYLLIAVILGSDIPSVDLKFVGAYESLVECATYRDLHNSLSEIDEQTEMAEVLECVSVKGITK